MMPEAQQAKQDIAERFDELLPKGRAVGYLECISIGHDIGTLIMLSFQQLAADARKHLMRELTEYTEQRVSSINWSHEHRIPRGTAGVWLASHFAVVLREAAIEHGVSLDV